MPLYLLNSTIVGVTVIFKKNVFAYLN